MIDMKVCVRDTATGQTETFNRATTRTEQGKIVVTDEKGFEHYFPVSGTMVIVSPQPPPWWRRIVPL